MTPTEAAKIIDPYSEATRGRLDLSGIGIFDFDRNNLEKAFMSLNLLNYRTERMKRINGVDIIRQTLDGDPKLKRKVIKNRVTGDSYIS